MIYSLRDKGKKKKKAGTGKAVAFVIIGGLTLLYCIAELAAAVWLKSLTLLSDGFHNLSDVVALYIAYWAQTVCFHLKFYHIIQPLINTINNRLLNVT